MSRFVNPDDQRIWKLVRDKPSTFTNTTKRIENKGSRMPSYSFNGLFEGTQAVFGKRPTKLSTEMPPYYGIKVLMNSLLITHYGL
jgi:hypothetical protein